MKNFSLQLLNFWRRKYGSKLLSLLSFIWLAGLGVASIFLWIFIEIADEVLEEESNHLDLTVLRMFQKWHHPVLNRFMVSITHLGDPIWLFCLVLIITGILIWRQKKLIVFTFIILTTGGVVLNFLLKTVFSRDRPNLDYYLIEADYYSFPSGHAMVSLICYGFLGYLLIIYYRRWQTFIISTTTLLILAIGLSRLYLGVHWLTDVLAGYAAGIVWVLVCILSLEVIKSYLSHHRHDKKKSKKMTSYY